MSEYEEYDISDAMPNKKNNKHKSILSDLKDMEDDSYINSSGISASSFLPSSMLKPQKEEKEKKKKEKKEIWNDYDPDDWFNEMVAFQNTKVSKSKGMNSLFDSAGITGKKKKKKKKNKDGHVDLVDYKKEFEPEIALYRNLLIDQNHFVESLQREYDALKSSKSSARGVNKQLTDLIENITDARTLSMQLVEKHVNAKKLIAELTAKQKKELGGLAGDGENMADFASNYLKQMLNERKTLLGEGGDPNVAEYTEDEIFDNITLNLDNGDFGNLDIDRSDETEKYLQYENRNVSIYVAITDDDVENYEFVAEDENGEEIPDYPMPNHTKISVNRSTNIATDTFGQKYYIRWK